MARLRWPDLLKAVAIVWIFLNHVAEQLWGGPHIANPSGDWPPLSERLAQLRPLTGNGVWDVPLNVLRYLGWSGDQGVQLFLIASGFGLTWGLLARHAAGSLPLAAFYRRRAGRIYPLWWGAHLVFLPVGLVTGIGLSLTDPAFYLSLGGIRVTERTLYYFAPAWWYVALLLQLYAVYPLLWEGLRRRGPLWLLAVGCATAFAARALGLVLFHEYVDPWQRGALFITRLPEFVLGMALAAWLHRAPERAHAWLRARSTVLGAVATYALATALSLTLLGMAVAPFLLGAGALVLLYALLGDLPRAPSSALPRSPGRVEAISLWVGRHSYSLYLMHHPLILYLVPEGAAGGPGGPALVSVLTGVAAAALFTGIGAVVLEWAVEGVTGVLRRWRRDAGLAGTVGRIAAVGAAGVGLLIGAELAVRRLAPQEVLGWGERPSLEPHPTFGWRLIPSRRTRLRWESYDYRVSANALGFPGPQYPEDKGPSYRILVTGDAFTSAEGVDTESAWPRLLEAQLRERLSGRRGGVEVLNFAVTGYGPNQYTAVVETFAPIYRPDLILIGFFVNEYQDVLVSEDEFRRSIGFGLVSGDSWKSVVSLLHLKAFAKQRLLQPLAELVRGRPGSHGYFLGNFEALERGRPDLEGTGRRLVALRLGRIERAADGVGARVVLAMIPAPVQVCGPAELAYYPRHVDLADSSRFDLDQPQRWTRALADSLGIGWLDLRPVLERVRGCSYQRRNMHWTAAGHRAVAEHLAGVLAPEPAMERRD